MESSSLVIPSGQEPLMSATMSNGYPHSIPPDNAGAVAGGIARSERSPSEPVESHPVSESSPEPDVADESYDAESPASDGDDGDVAVENSGDELDASSRENSSSPRPDRGGKHISSPAADETEYMRQNPDLYGLRRSGRARPLRNVADSSDSDSDVVAPRAKRQRKEYSRQPSKTSRSATASSASETDSDEYGGKNARSSKARRHRLKQATGMEPSLSEVRFSTRNAAKISNYNEEDDDSIFEDDAEGMGQGYWADGYAEDTRPAVDVVLNHRLKEGVDPTDPDVDRQHFEFYLKWQDKSHIHATWESNESLVNYRSTRRVDNYVRKVLNEELRLQHDPDAPPEDREKWNLDRERDVEAIEDYKQVERVIGVREADDGTSEYFVKWKRLFYDSCTWEPEDLVSEIAQREIDRFIDRSARHPFSDKMETNPATRKSFEPIHGTPSFLQNGELKDFQIKGLNFLAFNWVKDRNVILADEMGLGKTVQTVSFINWMRHVRRQQGPFIVIVPLSTMPAWAETFDNWTPDLNYVVYNGSEKSRAVLRDYELMVDGNPKRPKFHVLLTTYEYAMNDSPFLGQFRWQFMGVDEAHRLKNRDSQLYMKLVEWKCQARLLITGTPIQNNLAELASLMDFLNPGEIKVDVDMDLNSEAASQKLAELTDAIQPFMLRRTKSKVESDLPPKTEKIIRVELSDVQLEYYKNILTKNYAALNDGAKGMKQSLLNIMMELKKASNHPFMFPNAEARILEGSSRREDILRAMITSSGKMMLLDQLLRKLRGDGHRVLIFCQMVGMLNILSEYMEYRGYKYQRLDGTIPSAARRLAIEHYNAPESTDFAFLLSTRAGGLGINLMTADTVVLFDSDWNPQADLQAMARAHRIGQTRPVSVYRLVSKDTIEEEVIERARNKLLLEFITIQRGVTDKEASEMQNKMARAVNEPNSMDDISRILKRRGQKMFEQTDNQKKLEQLDIDSVLANAELHQTEEAEQIQADGGEEFLKAFDFVDIKVDDLTWDDIIPQDQLEGIKEAEKRRADAKYLEDVIEQNRPRKRQAPTESRDSREERKAKRQARAQVHIEDADEENSSLDPKRPLGEKEYRSLSRAFLRYGAMEQCEDLILEDARLQTRDRDTVRAALREITDKASDLVSKSHAELDAMKQSGRNPTKKEQKAILFDHHGVKRLNAHTIVERPPDMQLVRRMTNSLADFKNFRLPEATKLADYSCEWGAREDGMLLVGIARHGFGAWTQIRDDADLGLGDKFFLEEHRVERKTQRAQGEEKSTKSPGAVHLVRRAEYLLSVLRTKQPSGNNTSAKRAVENHHRNNKRNSRVGSGSVSASPAPSSRKGQREVDRSRQRSHTHGSRDRVDRHHTPSHDRPRSGHDVDRPRHRQSDTHDEIRRRKSHENGGSSSSKEDMAFAFFRPIVPNLKQVSMITAKNYPNKGERAQKLRNTLVKIGEFIHSTLEGEQAMPSLERRLWDHVSVNYWPNKDASGSKLQQMFEKVQEASKAPKESNGA